MVSAFMVMASSAILRAFDIAPTDSGGIDDVPRSLRFLSKHMTTAHSLVAVIKYAERYLAIFSRDSKMLSSDILSIRYLRMSSGINLRKV